jgi:hypothetical protein
MKLSKLSFAILLLLISFNVYSQDSSKVILRFLPSSLIDIGSFPAIEAGVEFKLSNRISWYNELGIEYIKNNYDQSDTPMVSDHGFKAKTELRYYFSFRKDSKDDVERFIAKTLKRTYVAVNLFATSNSYNSEIGYYYQGDTSMERHDSYVVNKFVWGFNFLIGDEEPVSKNGKLTLDFYAGVGVRFRYINTVNEEYDSSRDYGGSTKTDALPFMIDDVDPGFSIAPNLTLGIRLSYKL